MSAPATGIDRSAPTLSRLHQITHYGHKLVERLGHQSGSNSIIMGRSRHGGGKGSFWGIG
jgi:hypothetical protein